MAHSLTLFEHDWQEFQGTEEEWQGIERLNQLLGATVLVTTLRNGKRAIKATQFVGVFRVGTQTIQVLPKMFRAEEQHQIEQATQNLLYLLDYTGQSLIRRASLAALTRKRLDWFEVLTYLFASNLREEWQRGAVRNYEIVEDFSPVLKGKWRLTEQIRRPEQRHLFAVAYDEFTADHLLNRTFRFVVERLWRLTRDSTNRQLLSELRQWMDEITLLPSLSARAVKTIAITRLNQRFEPLLNLAQLFLDHESLRFSAGDLTTFAFVFDMNKLFETFVIRFIQRHRQEVLPGSLQSCELFPQARGAIRYLAKYQNRPIFQLQPDLAFRRRSEFPLLLDTKYKILNDRERKLGVAEADFYQMTAYGHRYACPTVILLYPQTAVLSHSLQAVFQIENSPTQVKVATIDLRQDLKRVDRLIQQLRAVLGGDDES